MSSTSLMMDIFREGSPPYSIKELVKLYNKRWALEQVANDPLTSAPKSASERTVRRLVDRMVEAKLIFELPRTKRGILYHNKPSYMINLLGSQTGEIAIPIAGEYFTPADFINEFFGGVFSRSSIISETEWDKFRAICARLVLSAQHNSDVDIKLETWKADLELFRSKLHYLILIVNSILDSDLWNPKFRELLDGTVKDPEIFEAAIKNKEAGIDESK